MSSFGFYGIHVISSVLDARVFIFDRTGNLLRKITLPPDQPKPTPHDWILYTLEVITQNYSLSGRCIIYSDTELYPDDATPPSKPIEELIDISLRLNRITLVDNPSEFPNWVIKVFSK